MVANNFWQREFCQDAGSVWMLGTVLFVAPAGNYIRLTRFIVGTASEEDVCLVAGRSNLTEGGS